MNQLSENRVLKEWNFAALKNESTFGMIKIT